MTIAIIGTGWGTRVQVPAFRAAGLAVTALAGHNAEKTAQIAAELGVPFATGDWRAVLTRADVQLVSICTPPDLHAEIAIAALEAGKHVLCEKPTALNATEARAMLAAAQAHPDLLAVIDHELRFLPALQQARALVAAGALGAIRHVTGQVIAASRHDPTRLWTWWCDAARGGGMFGAIGSHQIDTLRYMLSAEVAQIDADLGALIAERPDAAGVVRAVTADDYYSVRARFDNGTRATLVGSIIAAVGEPSLITLYGERGTLRWGEGHLWRAEPGGAFEDITPPHVHPALAGLSGDFPHGTLYLAHALRAYLSGERGAFAPAATFADGVRTQEALDAGRSGGQRPASRRGGGDLLGS